VTRWNPEAGELYEDTVPPSAAGERVDAYLASVLPGQSRSFLQKLIGAGFVEVNGASVKPSHRLAGGESLSLFVPELEPLEAKPEPMDLDVLYEDGLLIVVNKPPGMVVHPSPGHETGSLVNGLLHHCRDLSGIGGVLRPGIVHRLDRDTSGVLVAAKADAAHRALAAQFAARTTHKVYLALVHGAPVPPTGTVDARIGRHPRHRQRMAVVRTGGRDARTDYRVRERLGEISLLECVLRTGRTHQARVHLAHLGCPVVCDASYGRERALTRADLVGGRGRAGARVVLDRQALHAWRLTFTHPSSAEPMEFEAPLPADLDRAIRFVRRHAPPSRSGED